MNLSSDSFIQTSVQYSLARFLPFYHVRHVITTSALCYVFYIQQIFEQEMKI